MRMLTPEPKFREVNDEQRHYMRLAAVINIANHVERHRFRAACQRMFGAQWRQEFKQHNSQRGAQDEQTH